MRTRFLSVVRTGMRGPLAAAAGALLLATLLAASAGAVDITVIGVDNSTSPPTEEPLTGDTFRWLVEHDLTYHVPSDNQGAPVVESDTLAVGFHRSWMPVVAEGIGEAAFEALGAPDLKNGDFYHVSVVPFSGYSIGGATFEYQPGGGQNQPSLTVYVNKHPIPTAQIVVQVCHDNYPTNNVCDVTEVGLGGFKIIIEDAGGRYGASAGLQSYDVFGNPLGTDYSGTCSESGGACTSYNDTCNPAQYPGDTCIDFNYNNPILGSGIDTDANGLAYVKNLAPGKYGVLVVPPAVPVGEPKWQQTSTIEGKKVIDAWVKANEPPYFAEFGPPGPHVFVGFVKEYNSIPAGGTQTVSGEVVNLHMSRPPDYAMYAGAAFPHTNCWVGLNANGVAGPGIFAAPCQDGGMFQIPNVPPGNYQVVFWDDNLDLIFAFKNLTVDASGCNGTDNCNLGLVPMFQWFARMESWVFNDLNSDGQRACSTEACDGPNDEPGIPEQAVNLRWRDGSLYQSFATDLYGFAPFDEVFPFFSWLVAEVDFARFAATGARITVDNGGPIDSNDPWTWGGHLNPQAQGNPFDPDSAVATNKYRVEQGTILTQGFQGYLGQTSVIEWGKKTYVPGQNGGISGIVFYSVTRAEDDPRYGGPEPWEPGIPNVQVALYRDADGDKEIDDTDGSGDVTLADVDNYPLGNFPADEDVDWNLNGAFDSGDAIDVTWTDSWDATPPENCQYGTSDPFVFQGETIDCYDGIRNFNQIRPAVFDGGYAFDGLTPGRYIVEAAPPKGYQIVRSEDRNVDFGDEYNISGLLLPPECVGPDYEVPPYFSLATSDGGYTLVGAYSSNPGDYETPLEGLMPGCEHKLVYLNDGANAAADFYLFTEVPIATHAIGFILDDTANEFDPNSPQFGEKFAPPFLPVSIRDWTGREIGRTLSDGYGRYNFLAPSTWTNILPQPSGMSPNMLTTCMNAKVRPDGTIDPNHNPQYSQFCYTFQYMPGTTTYLDTPVVPVAAFTGADQFPLDCEFADRTPRIKQANNINGAGGSGPFVAPGGFLYLDSMGDVAVPNPDYDGINGTEPKTIRRDYGFGNSRGTVTLTSLSTGTEYLLGVGGQNGGSGSWGNGQIRARVWATIPTGLYQLTVTRAGQGQTPGRSSVNAVTVHVGGSPTTVVASDAPGALQAAIDAAAPGAVISVPPGFYQEMVILWKPVSLQGWGEATVIDAVKRAPESLQVWRDKVAGLLAAGLWDIVPGQEVGVGGIEPALLFTEEGAGLLALAKMDKTNPINSWENVRFDGFTVTGADTGGGIIANGWVDGMTISNNRVINNSGFYGGGIRLGHPTLIALNGDVQYYPDAGNDGISIHHNYVGLNGGLNGAGGGVSLCTGSTDYAVTDNYICGNFNMEQGAGVAHFGLSDGGLIARNFIGFNESFNQGLTVSGAGLLVSGQDPFGCPINPDTGLPDPACLADPTQTLTPGAGDVTIDANLILGNAAEAGDGGGVRLYRINGQDAADGTPDYGVTATNNMIVNNVAALAGGGVSIGDAANVSLRHNTIAHNDSTATAGQAFTPGIPDVSQPQDGAGLVIHDHSTELASELGESWTPIELEGNILWQNRQFVFAGLGGTTVPGGGCNPGLGQCFGLCPTTNPDLQANACGALPAPFGTLIANDGDWAFSNWAATQNIATDCFNCLFEGDANGSDATTSIFVADYFNGNRDPNIPQPEQQTIFTAAAFDEGGNFIRLRFGPLTRWESDGTTLRGDYHLAVAQQESATAHTGRDDFDFDGDDRPDDGTADMGADEIGGQLLKGLPTEPVAIDNTELLSSESAE